jgi:hypothetical protein
MGTWDIYERIIFNLGSFLAMANHTLSFWVQLPVNATGPLDPSITLTPGGGDLVHRIANVAIDFSIMLYQALDALF